MIPTLLRVRSGLRLLGCGAACKNAECRLFGSSLRFNSLEQQLGGLWPIKAIEDRYIKRDVAIETITPFHRQEHLMRLTGLKGFNFRCYFHPHVGFG
jgi:hypothetical protein